MFLLLFYKFFVNTLIVKFVFEDCSYVKSILFETKLPPEEGNPIDKLVLTQFPKVLNIDKPNPVQIVPL